MGCVFSKPDEKQVNGDHVNRKPLLEQHDVFINNNDHQPQQKPSSTSTSSQPPAPSRHSPPASRPSSLDSDLHPELDNIESLDSIRNHGVTWGQFKSWLREQNEGHDSDGEPLSLERYAIFLELFSNLERLELSKSNSEQCKSVFLEIMNHKEKFFGNYRCLKVIDVGDRKPILDSAKKVKEGALSPSTEILKIVNQKVEDKLSSLLGSYQNYVLQQTQSTNQRKQKTNKTSVL